MKLINNTMALSIILLTWIPALAIAQDSASDHNNRGIAEANQKNYKAAVADFNKAIELSPNNSLYYNNRGLARFGMNDNSGALSDYNKAIKLAPLPDKPGAIHSLATMYLNRATVKLKMGDNQGGNVDFKKVLELDPTVIHVQR